MLDGRVAGLERLLKTEVGRFALRQRVDELAELRPPPARAQQVMGERPRLSVKEALLVGLDVKRRSLIDRQQGFEGYQLTFTQQPRVTRDGCAEPAILPGAGYFKRAEIFGQSLADPSWKRGWKRGRRSDAKSRREGAAARQRVDVFVKDDRIRIAAAPPGGQRDVRHIAARLKMPCHVGRFALVERLERPVLRIVFEDNDGDRDRRVYDRRREDQRVDLREGLAELLQAHPYVANLFFTLLAD